MIKSCFGDGRNVLRKSEVTIKEDSQVASRSNRFEDNTIGQMNDRVIWLLKLLRKTNDENFSFK